MYDIIIKNGHVVLATGTVNADIGVSAGKIGVIGDLDRVRSEQTIDAAGKLVFPGFVDPHVHLRESTPALGITAVDDFYTGTVGAAFGGTTTLIDFAYAHNESALDTIRSRKALADGQVMLDYALHAVVEQDTATSLSTIAKLPDHGVRSIKLFMSRGRMADTYALHQVMSCAAANDLLVLVHAENDQLLTGLRQSLADEGRIATADFPGCAPSLVEVEAVQRAVAVAEETGAMLYIVHMSTAQAVDIVRQARRRGVKVIGETLPHYLMLTDDVYLRPNGSLWICSPPLRKQTDADALWQGLASGAISTLGSDHCGYSAAQKAVVPEDFRKIPGGLAAIETRVAVMFSEGVSKNRISLARFVSLLAANPARLFGLYPRKGVLAPGSDADICIFDPEFQWKITPEALHVDWGWNPHQGMKVTGKPVMTIARGRIVTDGDELKGKPGDGQFLPASSSSLLKDLMV